jgi:hypothetical protein
MITPVILRALFWVIMVFWAIAVAVFVAQTLKEDGGKIGFRNEFDILRLVFYLAFPVIVRIWFEMILLFFRMNETLTEILNEQKKAVLFQAK